MKQITIAALTLAALAGGAMGAHPLAAQSRHSQSAHALGTGFMLGASGIFAPGLTIKGQDVETDIVTNSGAGAGIQLGYGFNRQFLLVTTLDAARQGSGIQGITGNFGLVTLEVGARVSFPSASSRMTPYVLGAVGARALGAKVKGDGDQIEFSFSGGVVDVGGGLQYALSPRLALDSELRVGFGKFGQYEEDHDKQSITVDNSRSTRVRVGFSWYPSAH